MSGDGRTGWWSKDTGWWRRGRIVRLGRRFGPAGPAVLDWLTSEAKSQGPKRGHDGSVKSDYDAVAYGCFIDPELAEEIIGACVESGALDDFDIGEQGIFTCRISGWKNDIEKPIAAAKKASQRQDDPSPDDAACPPMSPDVPEAPPTEQDRTEQTSSLRSEGAPDALSKRVPAELAPVAEHVHERLSALTAARKVAAPSLRRVGDIVADFPDHDHRRFVADVVDYWQHGDGSKTVRKDFARVYRDFVSRKPAGATVTPLRGRNGPVVPSALQSADAFLTAQGRDRE